MTPARIIAEVAQGYEGKPDFCDLYVRAAAKAGADAVKFQIVYADDVAVPGYQYYDWFKSIEMDVGVWERTRAQARELGVLFFSDLSGERALKIAEAIEPDGIKIHSSNFFNRPLIERAFSLAERVLVSLGGIEFHEIADLVRDIEAAGNAERLTLMFGFQSEPTPTELSHLNRIGLLHERFPGISIGYMDHAEGKGEDRVHLSAMAMALGVDWIEKHLTLSRYLEIEDYVSALEPAEFAAYVQTLRRLDSARGARESQLSEEEREYRDKSVKKVVAARDLDRGHMLGPDDLVLKRTPEIPSREGFHDPCLVVGRHLKAQRRVGEGILESHIE